MKAATAPSTVIAPAGRGFVAVKRGHALGEHFLGAPFQHRVEQSLLGRKSSGPVPVSTLASAVTADGDAVEAACGEQGFCGIEDQMARIWATLGLAWTAHGRARGFRRHARLHRRWGWRGLGSRGTGHDGPEDPECNHCKRTINDIIMNLQTSFSRR